MDYTPKPSPHIAAFMQLLNTLPIMPKQMVTQIFRRRSNAQFATFFEYILRIGGILLCDNNFPDINVQSVEPQLYLKAPQIYIYFNLVKALYLHYRGATDEAKECCEKMFSIIVNNFEQSSHWDMVKWSYWLVHRNLKNPNTDYAFNITNLLIPKEPLIASQTAKILAMEQDIVVRRTLINTSSCYDQDKSRQGALWVRFWFLYATIEKANILSNTRHNIEHRIKYLTIVSALSVSDRLQTFWKEVIYLQELAQWFLGLEVKQSIDQCQLYSFLSNARTFSSTYITSGKYNTIIEKSISEVMSVLFEVFPNASEQEEQKRATERQRVIDNETKAKEQRCEWCHTVLTSAFRLSQHRQKHAVNNPRSTVAYISAAVPVIEEEERIKKRQREIEEETAETAKITKKRRGYSFRKLNV